MKKRNNIMGFIKKIYKKLTQPDKEIIGWSDKARLNISMYRPYPGGELFDYVVKNYNWRPPKTLEEWEKYFTNNTIYKMEEYDWIKRDPDYYRGLQFSIRTGRYTFWNFIKRLSMPYPVKYKVAFVVAYPISRLRFLLDVYSFPFEYKIAKKIGILDPLEI